MAARRTTKKAPILGLRTAVYNVPSVPKARDWYTKVLGAKPYFDEPYYVGFNVGGFELGIHPGTAGAKQIDKGVNVYWGVADAAASLRRLLKLGAKRHTALQDVGAGIKVATVTDPFGNIFGIIENPHFKA
jgi:predicted enzyme related to lactoylglutathione lyase